MKNKNDIKTLNRNCAPLVATNAFNFEIEESTIPDEIQLLPSESEFYGFDGRFFQAIDKNFICENSNNRLKYLPVDENHAIDLKGNGDSTHAMGWMSNLYVKTDGTVWAKVEWTSEGKEKLTEKYYKYISPVFEHTQDRNIFLIKRAALTNNPNLKLTALNNNQNNNLNKGENEKMDKQLSDALGISENASMTEAVNAVNALKAKQYQTTELNSEREKTQKALSELNVEKEKREKAESALNALNAEMSKIKKETLEKNATQAVESAINAGKIAPATREVYLSMCCEDGGIEKFNKIMENTPKSKAFEEVVFPKTYNKTSLNAEEAKTAKSLGYTEEEYAAIKEK